MTTKIEMQFDAVDYMRQQRERLSEKLSKMTNAETIQYFKTVKQTSSIKPDA